MWAWLIAVAVVGGLVKWSSSKGDLRATLDHSRLARLSRDLDAGKPLTLDQLEDGAVLARRAGDPRRASAFLTRAATMKGRRHA